MNQPYQAHPSFPTNLQYSQTQPHLSYPVTHGVQSHGPGAVMMPADLASLSQQGYIQQQQHLAQAQMMAGMMARQNVNVSASGSEGGTRAPSHKKKKVALHSHLLLKG